MTKRIRLSILNLLLVTAIASLSIALVRVTLLDREPVYLHVFGTVVAASHDEDRPPDSSLGPDARPWTRIATVHVYDGRPFGMFTPNNRQPSIGIDGKLTKTFDGSYQGNLDFWLDDTNLTIHETAAVNLTLDRVVYINDYYDCYLLSRSDDPYWCLKTHSLRMRQEPKTAGNHDIHRVLACPLGGGYRSARTR